MSKKTDPHTRCERQTLNEVLAAELDCLRPDNRIYGKSDDNGKDTALARPATYADDEKRRTYDLKRLYRSIGGWSTTRRRDPRTEKDESGSLHEPLSALCLSGGGIRSATFNLGVLQALARINLLGKFDYLSSVSGGGYIASWLRAWMHRGGVENVVRELGSGANAFTPLSPEPKPVSSLREYSNYLTPALGLFSGDTWSAAATIVRNLLLNWLMLLPLLGAVVGIPLLFLLVIRTPQFTESWPITILTGALIIETIASGSVYGMRRFAKSPTVSQVWFILTCVAPICLAAGALSAAGIGLHLPWAGLKPSRVDLPKLWEFCVVWCMGVPIAGWVAVELIAHFVDRAKALTTGKDEGTPPSHSQVEESARRVPIGTEFVALIASGAVGACLLVGLVTWWFSFLFNHPALYTIFVLPVLLGVYLVSRIVFIGVVSVSDGWGDKRTPAEENESVATPESLAGPAESAPGRIPGEAQVAAEVATGRDPLICNRIYSNDADREWWSRLSGWLLLVILSWTAITSICLLGCYLPDEIAGVIGLLRGSTGDSDPLATAVKWVIGAAGGASGLIAALTASSSKTPSSGDGQAKSTPKATTRLLAITGPIFVVCMIMTLSWSVKGIAEAIIGSSRLMDLYPKLSPTNLFKFAFDLPGNQQPLPWPVTLSFFGILLGLALLGFAASRIVNVNRFSLHGMYRNRLVRAYLGASNCAIRGKEQRIPDPFTGFALNDNFPLHELCDPPPTEAIDRKEPPCNDPRPKADDRRPICKVQRPFSIINTTLNLVHGEKLAWQQRKAASFSMTPLFCGNWLEGYRSSRKYGGPDGITVGTAITISGAAANPNMGYCSSPVLGFLMAMFNVRLGAWLGNTNRAGDDTYDHPGPKLSLMPLFAEMFGLTNSNRRYVNLSDGGHFDNLGLYEAVLRRCRYVLVSDAGRDESFAFEDLGNSIRKIRVDFGINIEFDTIQILPNSSHEKGLCCALGHIRYSGVDDTPREDDGLLVYIKPTLRGRGAQIPYDIYSYSQSCKEFPNESTADQWFSESQFESYRALGQHIVFQLTEEVSTIPEKARPQSNPEEITAAGLFEDFYAAVDRYVTAEGPSERHAMEETGTITARVSAKPRLSPPQALTS